MDSVRGQIMNEQARSKVRTEELYNIIKPVSYTHLRAHETS